MTKDLNEVTLLLRQLLTTSQPRSPVTPSCVVGTPDSKRSARRTTLVLPSTSLGTSFHVAEKTVNNALVFPTRGQLTAGFEFSKTVVDKDQKCMATSAEAFVGK